ncbi:MAG: hypothetical protein H6754_00320 [Candidatus Omnitrophica bacterium]|nr:hypothetical protein [Candidatus Omnitrophota bacterium]
MVILNKQKWGIFYQTFAVFIVALSIGCFLSIQKPLENDELFTHISSVENLSYTQILTVKIAEGNVSPLFYLTQKGFLDLIQFRLPFVWNGDWFVKDIPSQIALRCLANLFISLSITLVFFFFTRLYSIWAGIYGALVSVSSFMILTYWVVARPYALWNFLTTLQVLLFLYILRCSCSSKKAWWLLIVTHFLLSLTVTFSAVQIAAVSLILLFCKNERSILRYILLTIVPIALCLVYYFAAPKYAFFFTDSPMQLICASFPKERLALVFLFGIMLCTMAYQNNKGRIISTLKDPRVAYFAFIGIMFFLTAVLLGIFLLKAQGKNEGFPLSNRYFIYLTPIGIIAVVLFTAEMWRALKGKLGLRVFLLLTVISLLVFRLWWSWSLVRKSYAL